MNIHTKWLGLALAAIMTLIMGKAQAQRPVVQGVLFYSPTCGHCEYVINEVLPPLSERHGDQLQLVGADITSPGGQALYQAAINYFNIPDERSGVPTLIISATVLVGSQEIPDRLPALIEQYLAGGGADWPAIPGLAEALAANTPAPALSATPTALAQPSPTPVKPVDDTSAHAELAAVSDSDGEMALGEHAAMTWTAKLRRDPVGNSLAILMLVGMLAVLVQAGRHMLRSGSVSAQLRRAENFRGWRLWAVMALASVGLGLSIYMAFVETTRAAAVCGPIGDCNTVQQSSYALLFGWLPVGVLGVLGYLAMLITAAGIEWGRGALRTVAQAALLAMALFGTIFSIYLTFLEPFVIGATCMWCLTSALCTALILLITSKATLS